MEMRADMQTGLNCQSAKTGKLCFKERPWCGWRAQCTRWKFLWARYTRGHLGRGGHFGQVWQTFWGGSHDY